MTIADEITRLQTAKADLKASINAKSTEENQITDEKIEDYASFVDEIPTGFTPQGTIEISENGLVNVKEYENANVNVVSNSKYVLTLENMHDVSTDVKNVYLNSTNGTEIPYDGWDSSDYIEINGQVALSSFNTIDLQYCVAYTEDKKFIRNLKQGINSSLTSNVKYLRFSASATDMQKLGVFSASELTYCIVPSVINEPLSLGSFNINVDNLVEILNNLADRTGQTRYTLTLGAANLEKLTAEQKAIAKNKNWAIA